MYAGLKLILKKQFNHANVVQWRFYVDLLVMHNFHMPLSMV